MWGDNFLPPHLLPKPPHFYTDDRVTLILSHKKAQKSGEVVHILLPIFATVLGTSKNLPKTQLYGSK